MKTGHYGVEKIEILVSWLKMFYSSLCYWFYLKLFLFQIKTLPKGAAKKEKNKTQSTKETTTYVRDYHCDMISTMTEYKQREM